jgi:NADPH:quinone reductase-like Zn-dependent oxidoreductase
VPFELLERGRPQPLLPTEALMKAVVACDYGGAEVLRQVDIDKPTPADDQVLVKVHAVSVNPLDWHLMRGTPYLLRLASGGRKPNSGRTGVDYSGTVEGVGRSVTRVSVGDAVFGGASGALAEYVAVPAESVVLKPATLTFEQAAAVNVAGRTALQALRRRAHVQPGQKVLINGASGGVGTFAVQLAKVFGAEVTAVQSARNVDLVRSLGADHVIDYTTEDFTRGPTRYEVIVDNVGNRSLSEFRRVLTPKGKYLLVGGGGPEDHKWVGPLRRIVQMFIMSPFVSQDLGFFMAKTNRDDLQMLADLMAAGRLRAVIDRCYPFTEAAAAMRYLESGRARGKVVVTLAENGS